MSERALFVTRLLAGERMSDLCREFGISRQTGYKFRDRFEEEGWAGLHDASRAPLRVANRTDEATRTMVLAARRAHPSWGPRKLRAWLLNKHAGVCLPAASTIGDLLKKEGLVATRRRQRGTPVHTGGLTFPQEASQVWCADYKGQFRLGNGKYCYPLTITDRFSRFIIACEAFERIECDMARKAFEAAFRRFGLPHIIRTDNGTPFASTGIFGLSRLSAWWRRLGVHHERIEPAHPEQNGQHERMHLTLKQETTRPAAASQLGQQERFDNFVHEYNVERPHEALGQKPPASCFAPSARCFEVKPLTYPLHDLVRLVSRAGHVRLAGRGTQFFLSSALAGEPVGLRELENQAWMVSYADLDLGVYDLRKRRFEPAEKDDCVLQNTGT